MSITSPDQRIGANVRELRGGRSQQWLADQMRLRGHRWSQATVWAVERGERPLRLTEADEVARLLGATCGSDLLGGDWVGKPAWASIPDGTPCIIMVDTDDAPVTRLAWRQGRSFTMAQEYADTFKPSKVLTARPLVEAVKRVDCAEVAHVCGIPWVVG